MATIQAVSRFNPHGQVQIDPFAANPLLDDAMQAVGPTARAATVTNGDAPKMFASGTADLPPFTASGIDPRLLMQLPYQLRHLAASDPDPASVLSLFERQAGQPDIIDPEQAVGSGLAEYEGRMSDWLSGKWTNPSHGHVDPEQAAAADDDVFNSLLGGQAARHQAQIEAVAAANPYRSRMNLGRAGR